jgi:hypothetical protein
MTSHTARGEENKRNRMPKKMGRKIDSSFEKLSSPPPRGEANTPRLGSNHAQRR